MLLHFLLWNMFHFGCGAKLPIRHSCAPCRCTGPAQVSLVSIQSLFNVVGTSGVRYFLEKQKHVQVSFFIYTGFTIFQYISTFANPSQAAPRQNLPSDRTLAIAARSKPKRSPGLQTSCLSLWNKKKLDRIWFCYCTKYYSNSLQRKHLKRVSPSPCI